MDSTDGRERSAGRRDWGSAEAKIVSRIRTATDRWWYLPVVLSVAIPTVYLLSEYGLISVGVFEILVSTII